MYPMESGNNNIQCLISPYYRDIQGNINNNNIAGNYDECDLNCHYLSKNFMDYMPPSGEYIPSNVISNNISLPEMSSIQNSAFRNYNMINDYRLNNQMYPQQLEGYEMYNDFAAAKSPYFINDKLRSREMQQLRREGTIEDWPKNNSNYIENENLELVDQKTITSIKNTKFLSHEKNLKAAHERKKQNSAIELSGASLVSNSKQNDSKSSQYEMQADTFKEDDTDDNITDKNCSLNKHEINELNYPTQGMNNMNPNSIYNLQPQFFSPSFYAGHPQQMPIVQLQKNIPYFSDNHNTSSVIPSAISLNPSFRVVPQKTFTYPRLSHFSVPQSSYAVDYTPFTAHQLNITLDRLEDVPKSYEGFDSYNFFVVAYIHQEDENKEKLKTRSFEFSQGKSRNLINCDLQKSMLKIPWNGEEFLRLKIMEENEFRSDVLGRIELHIETLQQRTLLRVPIIGECNEHKGYLIFSVSISSNQPYTLNSSQHDLVKSYNSLIKTKTKKRNESEKNSIVNFFIKWCCELPAIDLN